MAFRRRIQGPVNGEYGSAPTWDLDEDEIDDLLGIGGGRYGRRFGRGGRFGGRPGWAGTGLGGRGVARAPQRGSQFFEADDALSRQPFFGFPGGAPAWAEFKKTGELAPGVRMAPEQRQFYSRVVPGSGGGVVGPGGRTAPGGDILGALLGGRSDLDMSIPEEGWGETSPRLAEPIRPGSLTGSLGGTMTVPLAPQPVATRPTMGRTRPLF